MAAIVLSSSKYFIAVREIIAVVLMLLFPAISRLMYNHYIRVLLPT